MLILVGIAIPSFRLLFVQLDLPKADLTIKATGNQWFWTYTYPDNGPIEFVSIMLQDNERKPGQPRLLAVNNEVVVPVNKVVRVQITGADVIHAFAVPAFGIKIDAIPGRLNETWFKATKEGIYYGQCSELCGKDHAFMPIEVRVVSDQAFAAWVEEAKKKFATAPDRSKLCGIGRDRAANGAGCNDDRATGPGHGSRDEENGYCSGTSRRPRRPRRPRASDRLAPVRLFDEPQGHRHAVPPVRHHRGPDRRRAVGADALGAAGAGHLPVSSARRRSTASTCSSPATA